MSKAFRLMRGNFLVQIKRSKAGFDPTILHWPSSSATLEARSTVVRATDQSSKKLGESKGLLRDLPAGSAR